MSKINNIETDINTWKSEHSVNPGDDITAFNVNKSPISNREDIITLNTVIGDKLDLIDTSLDTYNPDNNNDITDPNKDLISMINQLRVDIGRKSDLKTLSNENLISAINEVNNNIFSPKNSIDLIATYDFNIHGNYTLNGGDITYLSKLSQSNLPDKRISDAYPIETRIQKTGSNTTTYNEFTIEDSVFRVNGYEYRLKSTSLYFKDTYNDVPYTNFNRLQSNLGTILYRTDSNFDYYKIPKGSDFYESIYKLDSFMGLKKNNSDISFTIDSSNTTDSGDGTNITVLSDALISYVSSTASENNIVFDNIKLSLIDQSIDIGGTIYPFELTPNGSGIHWTSINPNLNSSFTISAGNLYYLGIKSGTNVESPSDVTHSISINDTKDTILVPKVLGFFNGVGTFGNYPSVVLPFIRIGKSDYDSESWDPSVSYKIGDVVNYNKSVYKAIVDTTGDQPDLTVDSSWSYLGTYIQGSTIKPSIVYVEGGLDSNDNPTIPEVNDSSYMRLCNIMNVYGSKPYVMNIDNRSFDMKDLNDLSNSVSNLEYNLQRLALNSDILSHDTSYTRNMFTESFNDDSFRDTYLEETHIDSDNKPANSADIIDGDLSMKVNWDSYDIYATTAGVKVDNEIQFDSVKGEAFISQPIYTKSTLINEFQVSAPPLVRLDIFPRYKRVITSKQNLYFNRTVNKSVTNNKTVVNHEQNYRPDVWSTTSIKSSSRVEVSVQNKNYNYFIRQMRTEVQGFNLTLLADPGSFNGEENVQVTVDGISQQDVVAGTDGSLNSTIGVSGFYTGNNKVKVVGVGNSSGYISSARGTTYLKTEAFSQLSINIKIKTVTTITDSVTTITSHDIQQYWFYDPVAETFLVEHDVYLDSLDIMIDAEDKFGTPYIFPDGKLPENVFVSIFETVAGIPNWEKNLTQGVIEKGTPVSISAELWTNVNFKTKVKLHSNKVYAVIIATGYESVKRVKSDGTDLDTTSISGVRLKVRTAKVGETGKNKDTGNSIIVNNQPYIDGVLLKSSNIVTWSPYQNEDLTFKLYECSFDSLKDQEYTISSTSATAVTDIKMQLDELNENSTYTEYELLSDTVSFKLNPNLTKVNIEKQDLSGLKVLARLRSTESSLSDISETPTISNGGNIYFGTVSEKSLYVTKNIDLSDGNTSSLKIIKCYIDSNEYFSDEKVKIFYTTDYVINNDQTDPNTSWVEMSRDLSYVGLENEFLFNSQQVLVGSSLRIKIVMNLDLTTESSFARPVVKNLRLFTV